MIENMTLLIVKTTLSDVSFVINQQDVTFHNRPRDTSTSIANITIEYNYYRE